MGQSIFEIWELDEGAKEAREAYDPATVKRARAAAMKRDLRLLRFFANKYKQEKNNKEAKTAYQKINNLRKSAYREYMEYEHDTSGETLSEDEIKRLFPPIMSYPPVAKLITVE